MTAATVKMHISRAFRDFPSEWVYLEYKQENRLAETEEQSLNGSTICSRRGCLYILDKEVYSSGGSNYTGFHTGFSEHKITMKIAKYNGHVNWCLDCSFCPDTVKICSGFCVRLGRFARQTERGMGCVKGFFLQLLCGAKACNHQQASPHSMLHSSIVMMSH